MKKFLVQPTKENCASIEQLSGTREWMDETPERHAYMCFPLTLTNRLGWGISFPEDITFIWDGVTDTTSEHVKILQGEKFAGTLRGNATISFYTGLFFRTDENTSTLTMPVPNQFIRGAHCYTTLISTSFYLPELPIAWRITEPNIEITIPAGTPVASILPISLGKLQEEYTLEYIENTVSFEYWDEVKKYGDEVEIKNGVGDWSKMYRDALNYKGKKIGNHETKGIKLKKSICPHTGQIYTRKEDNFEN